jgi:hypothetical protein
VARARSAAALLAVLALCGAAGARAAGKPPTGLHAFLLRSNEAVTHTFSRTPSFGWNPVPGARRYQFELSTGPNFSDNSIVWSTKNVPAPTVAVPISLPWITGQPYSLYAHVRAVTRHGPSRWSAPFGFNMRWPAVPAPLRPNYPGLIRWTPVAGASGYEVWMQDPTNSHSSKIFTTRLNMADEREYYTFHQDPAWTSTVVWRVRAMRLLYGATQNGLPTVSHGPWSPIYVNSNPAPASGPLALQATVTNVVSDAAHVRTHETMPAFLYGGDTLLNGTRHELWRVEVFTDQDCLNPVFRGAVTGSPAYVPRDSGPLAMPADAGSEETAWTSFLNSGVEPDGLTADGETFKTNELDVSQNGGAAKVDLWDSSWPGGRYYWTVMPVDAIPDDALATVLAAPTLPGDTTVLVTDATGIGAGDPLLIGPWPGEHAVVTGVSGNTLTLKTGLTGVHAAGEDVLRPSGHLTYWDAELAQDVCASGRVLSFGKATPAIVTGAGAPYASGLSPSGKLVAAVHPSPKFYGTPLVAWQPIPSADEYEIQVSRTKYPWHTRGSLVTPATSVMLHLTPGTWFYRVRGLDSLMTGAHPELSWSAPVKIVFTKPRFKIVH